MLGVAARFSNCSLFYTKPHQIVDAVGTVAARPSPIVKATTPSMRSVLLRLLGLMFPAASCSMLTFDTIQRRTGFLPAEISPAVIARSNSFAGALMSRKPWPWAKMVKPSPSSWLMICCAFQRSAAISTILKRSRRSLMSARMRS